MRSDFGYFEEKKLGKTYDLKLLKRIYPFTKAYKGPLIWSVILVVFITFLDLCLPIITKNAIDRYIVPRIDSSAEQSGRVRYFEVPLTDPDIRAVVLRHPDEFEIEADQARIPYTRLRNIPQRDLTILRKYDFRGLGLISLFFLLVILANFGFNFIQKLIMEYTGHRVMHDLRMKLFSHIQHLSIEFFTRNPVARLVTRVTNDVQNMHELFTSVIAFVFKDLFLLSGITLVLLFLNLKLALITFSVLPFVFYASVLFSFRARRVFRTLRIKIAEINTRFSETIQGLKVIQLFLHEKRNYLEFKELNHENYLAGMKQIRILAVFLPVIELLGVISTAIVVYYGGGNVIRDQLSLGELVAFLSFMKMYFRPIRDLAEKYNILQNAMSSAERIFLILDTRSTISGPKTSPQKTIPSLEQINEISFENVSFNYVPGEPVLKNIHLDLKSGDTVAVVGPTGSGKTTLINLITRFYDPSSGRVKINGRDLRDYEIQDFRSRIALVMQDPFLFSESIHDNIFKDTDSIPPPEKEKILIASNCMPIIQRLPSGLDTILGEDGASISSGERQLFSIARAFAANPQLILFDEATSYIDSRTEVKIQQALDNLMVSRTALIVAHRLSTVRHAGRIIVMNQGRIIESGTHDELIKMKGFYCKLNQLQNGIV